MFSLAIVPEALKELRQVPVFYRRQVEAAIRGQLRHEPLKASKNRKSLRSAVAGFEYEPPLWELRVGEWRVFYDVEEPMVTIRAVRKKPSAKTTEEIL